jgi:hypothetical protein
MDCKLRGIEGTKETLDKINKKMHEDLHHFIPNYNATQFSEVIKHRTIPDKYILIIPKNDKRKPEESLTKNQRELINDNITARDYVKQFDELDK